MDARRSSLRWQGLDWLALPATDPLALTRALDDEAVERWLNRASGLSLPARLDRRRDLELAGDTLHLVPHDGEGPLGFVALLRYPGIPGAVQSSIYLSARARGGRLYGACASLLWTLARDVLGHERLIASSHVENTRSQAARRRVTPGGEGRLLWEPWWPRLAVVFELTGPPAGCPLLGAAALARLVGAVSPLPGAETLRRCTPAVVAA